MPGDSRANKNGVLFALKTIQQKHFLLGKSARSSDGGNGKRVAKEWKDESLTELRSLTREMFSTKLSLKAKRRPVQDQIATMAQDVLDLIDILNVDGYWAR